MNPQHDRYTNWDEWPRASPGNEILRPLSHRAPASRARNEKRPSPPLLAAWGRRGLAAGAGPANLHTLPV